jgi:hypothetical protein
MEPPILTNKDEFPSDEIIFSHLGKTRVYWATLFGRLQADHPDFAREWRYYNDGKSWLMKVQRKGKTIFWLSVIKGGFRTTFYLPGRAAKEIAASRISTSLKKQFTSGPAYGKIKGITIIHRKKQDVEDAMKLVGIKLGFR